MSSEKHNAVDCQKFEELLTDYLDRSLHGETYRAVAEHALKCPLCHGLLNEVKGTVAMCRKIAEPSLPMVHLEARILEKTVPQTAMRCAEFEDLLTDYLDGFLPASVFHRWERHAVLCGECTDLPGTVVRSLAACVTYKLEEISLPVGLHEKILARTSGGAEPLADQPTVGSRIANWLRGFRLPISAPQLAPVAMMLVMAVVVLSQTISADGSLAGVYAKGFELAQNTYQQGADAWAGNSAAQPSAGEPISGGTFVDSEGDR